MMTNTAQNLSEQFVETRFTGTPFVHNVNTQWLRHFNKISRLVAKLHHSGILLLNDGYQFI